ncbi:3'(2'),5'-bisphosphate nucleotidase CysQ [Parapedomonas caeni]
MTTIDLTAKETLRSLCVALIAPVREAGAAVEAVRARGVVAREKADKSPVTEADEAAEAILEAALKALTPTIPVVGEEAFAAGVAPTDAGSRFWLVDPVDGTKEFLNGGTDYTVNIGLVVDGTPVFGIVMTPADGVLWVGGPGFGAFRQNDAEADLAPIRARAIAGHPLAVVASKSHRDAETDAYLARLDAPAIVSKGSSLKFCLLAEAQADIYPRFGPTSEWDTAAGHAVLLGAGGQVFDPATGAPFAYGKQRFSNGPFFAVGDATGAARLGVLPW